MPTKQQIDNLRAKLIKWSDSYHNSDVLLVSDEEYDSNVDLLESWSPNDKFFDRVGAPIKSGNKVKLKYPMPSLKKARIGKGIEKWLEESSGKIAALDKLDGSSAMVEQQEKQTLVSRGDGLTGSNITRLLGSVSGIPKNMRRNDAVRGELLMSEGDFAKYKDDFANTRALVNGVVNSSKTVSAAAKHVKFVAHEFVSPKLPWDKARVKLKQMGFTTAPTKIFYKPSPEDLRDYLEDRRKKSQYTLDGLVLIDLVNGKRISFKVDAPPVKIIVDHVEWNISQNSIYKPRVVFRNPVTIDGRKFTYATGHNAAYIQSHKIGPGAVIKIIIAGDVIPKVVGTVKGVAPQMPAKFVWNSNKVEALADGDLSGDELKMVQAKRLVTACVILGIEGVRIGTAEKLVNSDINNISELLQSSIADIKLSSIGEVNSNKLYQQIQAARKAATHAMLMDASGVWPKGYTITRFSAILEAIPYKSLIEKYKANKVKLRADIADLKGMSSVSALEFLKGLAPYTRWLKTLDFRPKADIVKTVIKTGKLTGKEYCFTKVRDKAVEAYITDNGGLVVNRVNRQTTTLIVPSLDVNSDKISKAEELKVPIMTMASFKKQHKI